MNNFEEEAASNNASGANEAIESGSDGAPTEVEDDEPVNRYRVGEEEESDNQSLEGTAAEVRRSGRIRERPKPYWVSEGQKNLLGAAINNEPSTYTEAMKLPDAVKWKQAADSEINSMEVNNVWDLVKRPDKVKTIGSRWVFKRKTDDDGTVNKYKARLVAKGYAQKYGVDYNEIFAPVVSYNAIRTVLAIAAQEKMHVHQMDVVTAFLNGELVEEVFLEQPEGFLVKDKEDHVYKLKKALYGLKQAPRAWYTKMNDVLGNMNMKKNDVDDNVYTLERGGQKLILLLYVDDLLLASRDIKLVKEVKEALKKTFDMKDLGEAKIILGLQWMWILLMEEFALEMKDTSTTC